MPAGCKRRPSRQLVAATSFIWGRKTFQESVEQRQSWLSGSIPGVFNASSISFEASLEVNQRLVYFVVILG